MTYTNTATSAKTIEDIYKACRLFEALGPVCVALHFHSQQDMDLVADAVAKAAPAPITPAAPIGFSGIPCYVTPKRAWFAGQVACVYSDGSTKTLTLYPEAPK